MHAYTCVLPCPACEQVQLKYAHGYLEALQEQLAALQGTSPAANDQYLAQGLAANLQGTTPTANDQYLADTYTSGSGHNPGRTDASAATTDSAAAEEHVVHTGYAALTDSSNVTAGGYGVEAHPVALQDSNDSDDGEFTHEVYHEVESHDGTLVWEYEHAAEAESAAAAAAEAAAEQAAAAIAAAAITDHPQQAVVAGQGHKAAQPASKASKEDTTSAGGACIAALHAQQRLSRLENNHFACTIALSLL
jgi:hypothetical protein